MKSPSRQAAAWTRHYNPDVPPRLWFVSGQNARRLRSRGSARHAARFAGDFFQRDNELSNSCSQWPERAASRPPRRMPASPRGTEWRWSSPTALSSSSPRSAHGKRAPLCCHSIRSTPPASCGEPLTTAGVKLAVTLTPFYKRLKEIQRRDTPVRPDCRDEHQGVPASRASGAFHTVQGEKGRTPNSARARRPVVSGLPARHRRHRAFRTRSFPGRSGHHVDERRDDTGMPKAVVGASSLPSWQPACSLRRGCRPPKNAPAGYRARAAAAVPCVREHQRARATRLSAARRWRSSRTRATSPTC